MEVYCYSLYFIWWYIVIHFILCVSILIRYILYGIDKDKEALFNVSLSWNKQHKLCRAFIATLQYIFNRYLPALLYLPSTTPFMRASARELLVPFFSPLVWCGRDSNPPPPTLKADALPTELSGRWYIVIHYILCRSILLFIVFYMVVYCYSLYFMWKFTVFRYILYGGILWKLLKHFSRWQKQTNFAVV